MNNNVIPSSFAQRWQEENQEKSRQSRVQASAEEVFPKGVHHASEVCEETSPQGTLQDAIQAQENQSPRNPHHSSKDASLQANYYVSL